MTETATRRRRRSSDAYELLRADILGGRIQPGEHLPYTQLCERYQTSVGVLREALMRLSEQGLVKGEPSQGFQVMPLSAADLRELTDARCELESLVLGRAMTDGDVSWEAQVIAAHHVLARVPLSTPDQPGRLSKEWVAAHAKFHATLLDACGNKRLLAIASNLRDSAEMYRQWSYEVEQDRSRRIAKEHQDIADAVTARRTADAQLLLRQHIAVTTEYLLQDGVLDDRP